MPIKIALEKKEIALIVIKVLKRPAAFNIILGKSIAKIKIESINSELLGSYQKDLNRYIGKWNNYLYYAYY